MVVSNFWCPSISAMKRTSAPASNISVAAVWRKRRQLPYFKGAAART
jgi:hypothetical protein